MKLFEYEGLAVFKEAGIRVPDSMLLRNPDEVQDAILKIGLPAYLKAQVLIGSRGKAGGVVMVHDALEAVRVAERMFSRGICGDRVSGVLVSKPINTKNELYVSVTIDRGEAKPVLLASPLGGAEIEDVAVDNPAAIKREYIDPLNGLLPDQGKRISRQLSLPEEVQSEFARTCRTLFSIMVGLDADLVEINPLAIDRDLKLVALDSKIILNDDALFRHREFNELNRERVLSGSELEKLAQSRGIRVIDLGGNVGIIGNGAGLTMATIDLLKLSGGNPADFLDVGGGASAEAFERSLLLLLDCPRIKVIVINIFGGITRCDEIAQGMRDAIERHSTTKPVLVRLLGTNESEARTILSEMAESQVELFSTAEEAALRAAELGAK